MVSAAIVAALLSISGGSVADRNSQDHCAGELLAGPMRSAGPAKPVEASNLARLRDFGKQDTGLGGEAPFSVSPDLRSAALVLRRGDPATDSYCIGVMIVPLDGTGGPRLVDVGGEPILAVSDVRGIPDLPIGNLEPVTPRWSPDGRKLAYLRRDGGRTQVWIAMADGSGARLASRLPVDARSVRWAQDGRSLVIGTRPGIAAAMAEMAPEERQGYLYDERFWTLSRSRPGPRLPIKIIEQRIDAETENTLDGDAKPENGPKDRPVGAVLFAPSPSGARAWTSPQNSKVLMGPTNLRVERGGQTISCSSALCANDAGALWWGADDELFVLNAPTPDNGGVTQLLRWRVGRESSPRLALSTVDALFNCMPLHTSLVCARETATKPRHLVTINLQTHELAVTYDPNPEFERLSKGAVRRLRWQNDGGGGSYGDLVLPPGHRPGMRHPLIVVQYQSRGFLRGGTGDEYPVHAFASRGFAVLSVERTRPVGAGRASSGAELMRMGTEQFAERRHVLSSLEKGVAMAISSGTVDPRRIGITGLSDGAATVQYALVNSDLFRAAAVSSCCDEPSSSMFAAGPGYADFLVAAGFPGPGSDGTRFWQQYSLAANAGKIRTPILMQLTEDEFRFGLETYGSLKAHHVPVELYVFADEYHQKWRPAHRLATYERAIDWFDFWLNGRTDPQSAKRPQYIRWRELARHQPR